jgi:hypothetical protein
VAATGEGGATTTLTTPQLGLKDFVILRDNHSEAFDLSDKFF